MAQRLLGKGRGMAIEAALRCENLSCVCDATAEAPTCSPYCASSEGRDVSNIRCECGHPVCAETIEKQLHGDAGQESASV